MGGKSKDIIRKRYFRDDRRQADLLNYCVRRYSIPVEGRKEEKSFTEEKTFTEEDFTAYDSELFTLIGEKGKKKVLERQVDSARLVQCKEGRFCLFVENQERVDYSMPVRVLNHESIFYHEQKKMLEMKHRSKSDLHTPEEWFSGLKKEDRLIPAVSLILYYGSEEAWDGAKDMEELLETRDLPEEIRTLIRNYPINLIQIREIDYLEEFETDLHETFGFIKYQNDMEKLHQFVEENKERFENLSEDAYDFITCQTGTRKLEQYKKKSKTKEGKYNMNKAFREWEKKNIQKGREEGERKGREEGERKGREEGERKGREKERSNVIQSVRMLFKNGASLELVSSSILVLSKEEIEEIYKEVCETV